MSSPVVSSSSLGSENLSNVSMASQNSQVPLMPNFSGVITEKLGWSNYVIWLAQILPWLRGRNPMGFVTGEKPCPLEYILDAVHNPTNVVNPEHGLWIQLDQMILGTITSSVTTPILGTIARKPTSAELGKCLRSGLLVLPNIISNNLCQPSINPQEESPLFQIFLKVSIRW